jgi:hypothetical protein
MFAIFVNKTNIAEKQLYFIYPPAEPTSPHHPFPRKQT